MGGRGKKRRRYFESRRKGQWPGVKLVTPNVGPHKNKKAWKMENQKQPLIWEGVLQEVRTVPYLRPPITTATNRRHNYVHRHNAFKLVHHLRPPGLLLWKLCATNTLHSRVTPRNQASNPEACAAIVCAVGVCCVQHFAFCI